ncbi:hypothetical protein Zmor_020140 [Zophobas morio]|mgnify:FL=1|uniref:Uncharacterized protein n=1 Tax=Zophobas morio TaxID=2755281 RepID=A0AA38I7B9_9CUCU|nr:hypothetical protein Zmor_020140 [Zophobas morio]
MCRKLPSNCYVNRKIIRLSKTPPLSQILVPRLAKFSQRTANSNSKKSNKFKADARLRPESDVSHRRNDEVRALFKSRRFFRVNATNMAPDMWQTAQIAVILINGGGVDLVYYEKGVN